ncbi:hypothetical protein E4P42_00875 [Mycobacterium sp. PS03-16]|uniref:DUF5994 family protein n=1 Tax=Mycobacterium sp. PS03-16 TaxID=2559611 RepID=UPI0010731FB9|nr:DUF5994 family protein [Mycobacterium sp. PS03-16]TFV61484.1 hypothetical protein E4P42_00875 [Mycobacterium sp. PS03-16]
MFSQQSHTGTSRPNQGPDHTPRLRLKRKAPASGYVDGGWWPHSGDLSTELPDLLAVLSVRLGSVERVAYHLGEWADAPRKIRIDGHTVKLDGFRRQPPNTIGISSGRGNDITLLVVPAQTEADRAHTIVMAAAAAGDRSSVDTLLGSG